MITKIKTYLINLRKRTDRKSHILNQFTNKPEFDVEIIEAQEHIVGSFGLWLTIKKILSSDEISEFDQILICEDDHVFTESYSWNVFVKNLDEAKEKGADILCGGVSWFTTALSFKESLLWVELFSGCQFTIIFKKFYETIRNLEFKITDAFDYKISLTSSNKFFLYPFISIQKDFGYSDVTLKNNMKDRVAALFVESEKKAKLTKYLCDYYRRNNQNLPSKEKTDYFDKLTIPTYIINFRKRLEGLQEIKKQFENKPEFDIKIVETIGHEFDRFESWQRFRKIASLAIENDDDVIIICDDEHEFTEHYSKDQLIRNIFEAYHYRVEILVGSICGFDIGIPVSENKFWIRSFEFPQFFILFRSVFTKILDFKYDENATTDGALSIISSYKMVMFPFISRKKLHEHSDKNEWSIRTNNIEKKLVSASNRLELIQRMYFKLRPSAFKNGSQISMFKRNVEELLTDVLKNDSIYIDYNDIRILEEKKDLLDIKRPEHKINVLVPFYNCSDVIKDCYESLINQEYKNFRLYFLDDNSSDSDFSIIRQNDRVILCRNEHRKYALANLFYFLENNTFTDDEIIIIVDGDDFLLSNDVFSRINHLYHQNKCLLTYGQFFYTDGRLGHCSPYSEEEFHNLRKLDWRVSHLKTFKYGLLKKFLHKDPNAGSLKDRHGNFYTTSYEVAMMVPLMEIAGYEKIYYNKVPVYGYRKYERKDSESELELKVITAREIMAKESFVTMLSK